MLKKLAKQTVAKLYPNSYKTLNWIEISKEKTLHNIEIAKTFSGQKNIIAVLKANAYGHGIIPLSKITGFLFVIFCLTAFLAPPFSGLDTLPSLAAVLIALSLILEDFVLYIIGLIIGFIGIGTIFVLGGAIYKTFKLL